MGLLRHLVIDNFYPDPWQVRNYALGLGFSDAKSDSEKLYYKGLLSTACHPYASYGLAFIREAVCNPVTTKFPVGEFRLLLQREGAEQMERTWIHSDSSATKYSGIVYLNTPEQCRGGTSFFRHREFGLYHMPEQDSLLASEVMRSFNVTWDQLLGRLSGDGFEVETEWELVTHIPMAFNRCLIFDSRLFHARTGTFGTRNEDGRLTQNFFFDF